MAVEFKYQTLMRDFKERYRRSEWLFRRMTNEEYHISNLPLNVDEIDGIDLDDIIESTVTIWHDDAEIIATEFWFHFP